MSQTLRNNRTSSVRGFTLIEILLVIGIIAVLATVVIVALDPATRFKDARNARRHSDVESLSAAVAQYVVDNQGTFPSGVDATERQIGTSGDSCEVDTGGCNVSGFSDCVDLTASLARYLKEIPYDQTNGVGPDHSHYSIMRDGNNIVTIRACDAEDTEIYVSR